MSCFVMVRGGTGTLRPVPAAGPALLLIVIIVPVLAVVPILLILTVLPGPVPVAPSGSDPVSRAIAGGRARASAPARFARLIARASRRAHFACASNRGRSAPGRRDGKRSARTSPPSGLS